VSNLIKPLVVRDGIEYGQHPVYPKFDYRFLLEVAANKPIFTYCEKRIDSKTGKSEVCEHKMYFRWEHLPT